MSDKELYNLTQAETDYLISNVEQAEKWVKDNAPADVSKAFSMMFKLVQFQNVMMVKTRKTMKDQSNLLNEQNGLIEKSNENVDKMLDTINLKKELFNTLNGLKETIEAKYGKNNQKSSEKA